MDTSRRHPRHPYRSGELVVSLGEFYLRLSHSDPTQRGRDLVHDGSPMLVLEAAGRDLRVLTPGGEVGYVLDCLASRPT